jgi:tetratricopeptide (TPR) repeat protein
MRPALSIGSLIAIATAALLSQAARAQAPTPAAAGWAGRRVVMPFGGALHTAAPDAKAPGAASRDRQEFRVYKVESAEDDRLWVVSDDDASRGWIAAVDAIPIERAVAHFTARIDANPSDASNYVNRAAVWTVLGDLDRALLDDTEAVRIDRDNALAYHNRGYTWAKKKDLDRALADFTRAILIDPQYARAYNKRGFVWLERASYDRAVADFTRAVEIDPMFARAYHNRGNTMLRRKDYDKAIADYTQAIRFDREDVLALVDRASAEHGKGDDSGALADLTDAIRRRPDGSEAFVARAWLLATSASAGLRDGKQAVLDATKACKLTRDREAYPLGALAAALAERGDFDRAVRYQERAQALYKSRDDVAEGRDRLALYKAKAPYHEPPASMARPEGASPAPSTMDSAHARPDRPGRGGRGV